MINKENAYLGLVSTYAPFVYTPLLRKPYKGMRQVPNGTTGEGVIVWQAVHCKIDNHLIGKFPIEIAQKMLS